MMRCGCCVRESAGERADEWEGASEERHERRKEETTGWEEGTSSLRIKRSRPLVPLAAAQPN